MDIYSILESNLLLPLELINFSKKYNVATFVNTDTVLSKNINSYSLSKNQFKEWLDYYSRDMLCINISIEHFYGPFDDRSKFVSHIVNSLRSDIKSIDLTYGMQERDFIYIDDVVNAFIKIIKHNHKKTGLYNYEIGSGVNITIKSFVTLIANLLDNSTTKLNFGAIPYRENEVMRSDVDIKAVKSIGWRPLVELEEGLRRTLIKESEG